MSIVIKTRNKVALPEVKVRPKPLPAILRRDRPKEPEIQIKTNPKRKMVLSRIGTKIEAYTHNGFLFVKFLHKPGLWNLKQCLIFEEPDVYYWGSRDFSLPEYKREKLDILLTFQLEMISKVV